MIFLMNYSKFSKKYNVFLVLFLKIIYIYKNKKNRLLLPILWVLTTTYITNIFLIYANIQISFP